MLSGASVFAEDAPGRFGLTPLATIGPTDTPNSVRNWAHFAGGEVFDAFKSWDTTSIDLTILSIEGGGGGRVRTAEGFKAVLEAGDFTLTEIIPTASSVPVIGARPTHLEAG